MRSTLLSHGAAGRDRLAGLVDAQAVLAERHLVAQAFGDTLTHDRLAADGVDQVKGYFIACLLGQVHAPDDGHFVARLEAQVLLRVRLLGQTASQPANGGGTLHTGGKQPD